MTKPIILVCAFLLSSNACASWTMVVIPDTQKYRTPETVEVFDSVTQWIVDNKDARNIAYVVSTGDITDNNTDEQWGSMAAAYGKLNGVVPYTLITGNHDYVLPDWQDRITLMNDYFALADNPLNTAITTEWIPGEMTNSYADFTAPDGREMLLFGLEFWPRPEVVAWADGVASLPQYQDHTAMLAIHSWEGEDKTIVSDTPISIRKPGITSTLWDPLVGINDNFELVVNGHTLDGLDLDPDGPLTTARQTDLGSGGQPVHQIAFNAQEQPNGGNGYIQLFEFLDDGTTVQVRTYSPTLDHWITDDLNEFQITLSPLDPLLVWRNNYGETTDGLDFLAWQRGFNGAAGASSSAVASVPEPSTSSLALLIVAILGWLRHAQSAFRGKCSFPRGCSF